MGTLPEQREPYLDTMYHGRAQDVYRSENNIPKLVAVAGAVGITTELLGHVLKRPYRFRALGVATIAALTLETKRRTKELVRSSRHLPPIDPRARPIHT